MFKKKALMFREIEDIYRKRLINFDLVIDFYIEDTTIIINTVDHQITLHFNSEDTTNRAYKILKCSLEVEHEQSI
jgi:hypothetical protein